MPRQASADGNELLSNCIAAERVADGDHEVAADAIACMAYLNRVSDMNMMYRAAALEDKAERVTRAFCSPDHGVSPDSSSGSSSI